MGLLGGLLARDKKKGKAALKGLSVGASKTADALVSPLKDPLHDVLADAVGGVRESLAPDWHTDRNANQVGACPATRAEAEVAEESGDLVQDEGALREFGSEVFHGGTDVYRGSDGHAECTYDPESGALEEKSTYNFFDSRDEWWKHTVYDVAPSVIFGDAPVLTEGELAEMSTDEVASMQSQTPSWGIEDAWENTHTGIPGLFDGGATPKEMQAGIEDRGQSSMVAPPGASLARAAAPSRGGAGTRPRKRARAVRTA